MEASGITPVAPSGGAAAGGTVTLTQAELDAAIAAAVAKATGGIAPDALPADEPKPDILDALKELGDDAEHSSFASKVLHLAEHGYGEVVKAEQETPALRTALSLLEALIGKVVV